MIDRVYSLMSSINAVKTGNRQLLAQVQASQILSCPFSKAIGCGHKEARVQIALADAAVLTNIVFSMEILS